MAGLSSRRRAEASRAVGVDIDPVFVAENRVIAAADPRYAQRVLHVCRMADRRTCRRRRSSPVTCMPHSMDLLKPKFETALKPGTRIVSHAFNLDGWEPLPQGGPDHRLGTVYLWVV